MCTDDLSERRLEATIEKYLLSPEGGYEKGDRTTYDPVRAIDMSVLVRFLKATQGRQWGQLLVQCAENVANAENELYTAFQNAVASRGLVNVLRNELPVRGARFRLCYFAPASGLNPELTEKYKANILSCTRQFPYSSVNTNTIDMVLSLNGIPVVALELKCQFKNQTVRDSIRQWKQDRDPRELVFRFNSRILAFFGVDLYNAVMTTELKGPDTSFMPYDQGSCGAGNVGGKGNPPGQNGEHPTAYLWKNVLQRDHLMKILQEYVMVQEDSKVEIIIDNHGREREKTSTTRKLIFPRYHQLDAVEKLVGYTLSDGGGHSYLVQHSAGSGKSNTIAWLTYQLDKLHDENDNSVFDGVLVITDRRILNSQLQNTILGFDHTRGQITVVRDSDNTRVLADAIENGARIIICTLQRFSYVMDNVSSRAGKRYAVIVDEAHSSQSGRAAANLNNVLADTEDALREWERMEQLGGNAATGENPDGGDGDEADEMDPVLDILARQGRHENLSFYAFTATPKPRTLRIFGKAVTGPDGNSQYVAHHVYSMKQAIEEGFILDVLKNYTTFATAFKLIEKTAAGREEYKERPATRAIMSFYNNHEDTIAKKTAIIVEQFRAVTLGKINGGAKAMVVASSRMRALFYYNAVKKYCLEHDITDVHPLVAFSGELVYMGRTWTEPQINSAGGRPITEENLPRYFASDIYNMLIVADKYQTGFDEPRLHTMFVDKALKKVKAVQTLSRLNRVCRGKTDTYVFDFVNREDSIKNAFEPYYKDTELVSPADVSRVYTFEEDIKQYSLWDDECVETFYNILSSAVQSGNANLQGELSNFLKPVVDRYNSLEEDERYEARAQISGFVRFYAFAAQIWRSFDAKLYKLSVFCETLLPFLAARGQDRVDLSDKLELAYSSIRARERTSIRLEGTPEIGSGESSGGAPPEDNVSPLEKIIERVNAIYQGNFTEEDRVMTRELAANMERVKGNVMERQALSIDENQFVESMFPEYFNEIAMQCFSDDSATFGHLFEDADKYDAIQKAMGKMFYTAYRHNIPAGSLFK